LRFLELKVVLQPIGFAQVRTLSSVEGFDFAEDQPLIELKVGFSADGGSPPKRWRAGARPDSPNRGRPAENPRPAVYPDNFFH
jgi:hypothetical protein